MTKTHLIALILVLLLSAQAKSVSVVVNTTADGTFPPITGLISLRMAIATANSSITPTTITFDPTVFASAQTILLNGNLLELSNISQPTTITGPAAGVTVSGNNASRVFQIDSNVTATISNVIITDGLSSGGAGIYNSGTVTLTNVTVSSSDGNNTSLWTQDVHGGGIYNSGTATLTNVSVSGNTAWTFYGNSDGGGIYNSGTATLTNVSVFGNTASATQNVDEAYGGGIYNSGTATLTNVTVCGNIASGLYNDGEGGGIYNSGTATLTNVTVSGNTATVSHVVYAYGGGIYNYATQAAFTIANTIVANNNAATGGPDVYGDFNSVGWNLIGKTNGSAGFNILDLTGTIASPLAPKLGSLADNGGPTPTMALLAGSPAIDHGYNGYIPTGIFADQRGLPRIANGRVDIGAYEYQPPVLRPMTVDLNHDGIPNFYDFSYFAMFWLDTSCSSPSWCEGRDFDHDGVVGIKDLQIFAEFWLWPVADLDMDGAVNFTDYAIFAYNWMDDTCCDPNWCEGTDFDHSGSVDMLDLATFTEHWLEGI